MNSFAIVTSIQEPTSSIIALQSKLETCGIPLIIAGDRKGPAGYPDWADFLHIDQQREMPFELVKLLPEGHYARKNIAYLHAFSKNAELIYETDDDNRPDVNWEVKSEEFGTANCIGGARWSNVYKYFTEENVWPRGLALEFIHEKGKIVGKGNYRFPVRQGLANGSPDVDAIWRLSIDHDIQFSRTNETYVLDENVWSSFNSQNTWWSKSAFPLMYLPSHVSFRMTDIWRSFITQRCLWAMGARMLYYTGDVIQERNPHNLLRDFEDEIIGYRKNDLIVKELQQLQLLPEDENAGNNLRACYEKLVEMDIVPSVELELIDAWLLDCGRILH